MHQDLNMVKSKPFMLNNIIISIIVELLDTLLYHVYTYYIHL